MKGKICILISVVLVALAVCIPDRPGETWAVARKVERKLSKRLSVLEKYADKALAESPYEWTDIGSIPRDMTIYRYLDDSIQCWVNQFSVANDDILSKPIDQRLTNPQASATSPLAAVTDTAGFFNFGPKWFLAKSKTEGHVKVIYGIALTNSLDTRTFNGVNPKFHIGDRYSFKPLTASEGSVVYVEGRPLFKVQYETLSGNPVSNGLLIWLAFAFYVLGSVLILLQRPDLKRFFLISGGILLAVCAMYIWGRGVQDRYIVFSPTIYADGTVFYSLGAILFINIAISLTAVNLFIIRRELFNKVTSGKAVIQAGAGIVAGILAIAAYTHFSLRSIILNSNISLELYKFETLSRFTFIVYASYLSMLTSIPILAVLLRPVLRRLFGVKVNSLSPKDRILFASGISIYLVILTSVLGFVKEQDRIEVMANRLAVDRDIALELQLRRAEAQIASDPVLASLTLIENGEASIEHRLADVHFSRLSQGYLISAHTGPVALSLLRDGEPINEGSNFVFIQGALGYPTYAGLFIYDIPEYGLRSIVICVEPRAGNNDEGYAKLLDIAPPGRVSVPSFYSYAHYDGRQILHYKGNYAYSTRMDDDLNAKIYEGSTDYIISKGYTHFINRVADREAVIFTRESISAINYLISAVIIALILFLLASLLALSRSRKTEAMGKSYYRTRINWVLMISLILTLLALTLVSVTFVYKRNESNLYGIMSDKITTIQTMLEAQVRGARSVRELTNPGLHLLENVAEYSHTDVSLYAPDGRICMTTSPRAFENLVLGSRVNGDAYDNIIYQGHRYFINRENLGMHEYFSMYAPLLADDGSILAIISAPYTDETYDFERDAVIHSMMIVSVFIILLLIARFITSTMVDRMFKPLSEMGRKMSNAGLDRLEKVQYDRDDEISVLVEAYNRMVDELSESSKKLAQAERDKAWSGMARQVAHEIKNPLTPMKLQLQRIIRLKSKNDPSWQSKFDDMAKVLLDHIDILTDTANEFSTFAKLYTEEPSVIRLDEVLQEEISMFDSKGDLRFEYFGLKGTTVSGPKPQLTRVFVNLINNSVQALDGVQGGEIRVSLRNSVQDGFFDIVFEDNGPGVSPENEGKLFTPNFTTKNGGSGLGLAISRSILERCGASISYSKSFALGGACFTIRYPKS